MPPDTHSVPKLLGVTSKSIIKDMNVKMFFFDLETTGLHPSVNGIHQMSGRLYVDFKFVSEFNCNVKPFERDVIEEKALEVSGKTVEMLKGEDHYSPMAVYKSITKLLGNHVDKFNKQDKVFLCGYNNASFDNQFLRSFFEKCGDKYFGSWFWSSPIDVFVLASQHLMLSRHQMADFKLSSVAKQLGIEVLEDSLHDAYYDLHLTEEIYQLVSGTVLSRGEVMQTKG